MRQSEAPQSWSKFCATLRGSQFLQVLTSS